MKKALIALALLCASVAVAETWTPIRVARIFRATAPSTSPGGCTAGSSPNVLALDSNVEYKCVSTTYTPLSVATATALAANGANCSAGQAALGVDASGAAEGCWTTGTVTGTGTEGKLVAWGPTNSLVEIPATWSGTTLTLKGSPWFNGEAPFIVMSGTGATAPPVYIIGADATGGAANGGDIVVRPGFGDGAGLPGQFLLIDPTSGSEGRFDLGALSAFRIWNLPNQSGTFMLTTDNAPTATALAANGADCDAGQAALGVDASGAAEGCWTPSGTVTGTGTEDVIAAWDAGSGALKDSRFSQTENTFAFTTRDPYVATFDLSTLTGSQSYTLPNETGTFITDASIASYIPFESLVNTLTPDFLDFASNTTGGTMERRIWGNALSNEYFSILQNRGVNEIGFQAHTGTSGGYLGSRYFKFYRGDSWSGATVEVDTGGISSGGPVIVSNTSVSGGVFQIMEDSDNGTNWWKLTASSLAADATCTIGTDGLIPLACQALQTTVTGNAGTATALAADGADCSAGSAPIGVSASGAAQSCFAVQASDADLTALAGVTSAADALPYFTGSGSATTTTLTTQGRALIDDTTAAAQRATVGALYSLPFTMAVAQNFGASATLYFGLAPKTTATSGTAARNKTYIRKAGIIRVATVFTYSVGTAGSGEDWYWYVRINDTTDYEIAHASSASAERNWTNATINITVADGDYFEIKTVTPAFATPPTNSVMAGYLLVE